MDNRKRGATRERLNVEHSPELSPEDWATFVEVPSFTKAWKKLGLDEKDRRALQIIIMSAPDAPIVKGTGGLRKIRFASDRWGSGKRSGARVCYVYVTEFSVVFLLSIYMKKDKDSLTAAEKQSIKKLIQELRDQLRRGRINV